LNGDGIRGLFTVGEFAAEQLVFLGNGDGTFTQSGTLGPGVFGYSAIGDFNGDGKEDIVATYFGGTASLLLGNGDGTFQLSTSLLNSMPGCPIVGGTGDFNGDGRADLMFLMECQTTVLGVGAVAVSSGNGDGTFQSLVISAVGNTPLSAAVSDLNGDGKLDLALGGTGLMILQGNGDGTFQAPDVYSMGGLAETIADFNSDGKFDVASVGLCPVSVGLVFGNGDGTFGYPSFFTLSTPPTFVQQRH
jgi:uncharacterized protein (DUF2141 family)